MSSSRFLPRCCVALAFFSLIPGPRLAAARGPQQRAGAIPFTTSGAIAGRVAAPEGSALGPNIRIVLRTAQRQITTISPDKNGEFRLQNLSDGVYFLDVSDTSDKLEPLTQEVEVRLGRLINLTIYLQPKKLTIAGGKPAGNVVSVAALGQKIPSAAKRSYERAVALAARGAAEEAVAQFKEALAVFPNYIAAHNSLALELHKLRRFDEAIVEFKETIKIDAQAFAPRVYLGIILVEQKSYDEAVEHLKTALAIDASEPKPHLYLGIALLGKDELVPAYDELSKALALGGDEFALAHYYMAFIHAKRGERSEAAREIDLYLASHPTGELADHARQMQRGLK